MIIKNFKRCVNFTIKDDRLTISCKLGLWSVSGPVIDAFKINDEAMHYFIQYKSDGEYDKLLG